MLKKEEIIQNLKKEIQGQFKGESTGHDWFHIERVWRNAKLIAKDENCNAFIVELGALLHDIADHKFVENYQAETDNRVKRLLGQYELDSNIIEQVLHIVHNCSFKGGIGENKMKSIEGFVVQDADRLDAIGAIGVARTFAYGGKYGNVIYDPEVKPTDFKTEEEYRKKRTHTINHFYEKLLLLQDLMNTETGKQLAKSRHDYMKGFLDQFYAEWNGLC
jgi:uncharacterized protein